MKKILFAFLLLPFLFLVQAQAQSPAADTTFQRFKWEIGTDVLWVLKRNTVPYSLFLRIHQDNQSAYRFRFGGDYIEHTNPLDTVSNYGKGGKFKTELNMFLSVGKEWEKIHGRLRVFYGSDVFARYNLTRSENNVVNYNTFLPITKGITAGLSPFVGVQYFIHPHFSVSTEVHLNLALHQYKKRTIDINSFPEYDAYNVENYKYFKADFLPFSTFNLNYHF